MYRSQLKQSSSNSSNNRGEQHAPRLQKARAPPSPFRQPVACPPGILDTPLLCRCARAVGRSREDGRYRPKSHDAWMEKLDVRSDRSTPAPNGPRPDGSEPNRRARSSFAGASQRRPRRSSLGDDSGEGGRVSVDSIRQPAFRLLCTR